MPQANSIIAFMKRGRNQTYQQVSFRLSLPNVQYSELCYSNRLDKFSLLHTVGRPLQQGLSF